MMKEKKHAIKLISDQAVAAKTGKDWKEWFALLDRAGAKKMSHKEIVTMLNERYTIGQWWQQMITVTYEQVTGKREKHEKPEGYQISVSKTMNVQVSEAFAAFVEQKRRKKWLPDAITIRKATENKSLRIRWNDGTSIEAQFYPKPNAKTQVVVQHGKLPNAKSAEQMKTFWRERLEVFAALLARMQTAK